MVTPLSAKALSQMHKTAASSKSAAARAGLIKSLRQARVLLKRTTVKVTPADAELVGVHGDIWSEVQQIGDELKRINRCLNKAGFAHTLASICCDNVAHATVNITFEADISDDGGAYQRQDATVEWTDTVDGGEPRMGGYADDEISDRLDCDYDLGFLDRTDTTYTITGELTKKLFKDGDYKAFLVAAQK